jgi:hypothetical protein
VNLNQARHRRDRASQFRAYKQLLAYPRDSRAIYGEYLLQNANLQEKPQLPWFVNHFGNFDLFTSLAYSA